MSDILTVDNFVGRYDYKKRIASLKGRYDYKKRIVIWILMFGSFIGYTSHGIFKKWHLDFIHQFHEFVSPESAIENDIHSWHVGESEFIVLRDRSCTMMH